MSNTTPPDQGVTVWAIPFAGGHGYSYRPLQLALPPSLTWVTLELPGHGRRIREPLLTSLQAMADDLLAQMLPRLTEQPYVVYGHSMGGVLSHLVLHRLAQRGVALPRHWLVSGARGPSRLHRGQPQSVLSREAFIAVLQDLQGLPAEVMADQDLMAFFEPILRADFLAVECHRPQPLPPLDLPLTVLYARQDRMVSQEEAMAWSAEVTRQVAYHAFDGNHFFINSHGQAVARLIAAAAGTG